MKRQKEVLELLDENKNAMIYRDLKKGIKTFRVVTGIKVKSFPLSLFEHLKQRGLIVVKSIESFHVVYKIVSKVRRTELGVS